METVITILLFLLGYLLIRGVKPKKRGEFRSSDIAVAIRRERRGR